MEPSPTSAAEWDDEYTRRGPVSGEPPVAGVVDLLTHLRHGRALDLGCGAGRNALWLASRGWQVDAVDHSKVALRQASAVAGSATRAIRDRVRWVHADVTDLTFPPAYDLALLSRPGLTADDLHKTIQRVSGAIKPEGFLAIVAEARTSTRTCGPESKSAENGCSAIGFASLIPEGFTVVGSGTNSDRDGNLCAVLAQKSPVGKQLKAE